MENIEFRRGAIDAGDCIGCAWELVKRNFGLYLGAGLLTLILVSCIPCINFVLFGPIIGGFTFIVLRDIRDEPIDFGMLFKGFDKFLPLMIMGLIQAIPGIIFQMIQWTSDIAQVVMEPAVSDGNFFQDAEQPLLAVGVIILFIAYFIFQIVWNFALIFAIPLIMEHNLGVIDAARISISAVFGNFGGLIILALASGLVALLGMVVLCVGIFVAIPVVWAANVFAYRQVFPSEEDNANMFTRPPAYGSIFGNDI